MSDLNNIKIGNVKVTVLEDGYLNLPKEVLKNISPEIEKTLTDNVESDLALSNINTFLIEQNNEKFLKRSKKHCYLLFKTLKYTKSSLFEKNSAKRIMNLLVSPMDPGTHPQKRFHQEKSNWVTFSSN